MSVHAAKTSDRKVGWLAYPHHSHQLGSAQLGPADLPNTSVLEQHFRYHHEQLIIIPVLQFWKWAGMVSLMSWSLSAMSICNTHLSIVWEQSYSFSFSLWLTWTFQSLKNFFFFFITEHRIISTTSQEKRKVHLPSPVTIFVYWIQSSLKSLEEIKLNSSGLLPFVQTLLKA